MQQQQHNIDAEISSIQTKIEKNGGLQDAIFAYYNSERLPENAVEILGELTWEEHKLNQQLKQISGDQGDN